MEFPPQLNGAPTVAYQVIKTDNLRPEVRYITAWPGAGFTNDMMLYTNLIYLGLITERVPIIPLFTPMHVAEGPSHGPTLDFGDVFDIPRLQRALRKPILEWRQVKDPQSKSVDPLGCWNLWEAVQNTNAGPHWTVMHERLKLDISYTTAPSWIKILPNDNGDPHAAFWALARLQSPKQRAMNLRTPARSPNGVSLPPDDHLLCFDNLYYVGAQSVYEFSADYSPAWRFVGRHIHFTRRIQEMADSYVRQALGVTPHDPTPPYISVHVRHGDFKQHCQVRAELLANKGIAVDKVIMTSDERNGTWWEAVAAQGWVRPDHAQTVARHGLWYPILIDAAIQAAGIGFVGTLDSTVSLLAAKRVATWHNGSTRMVRWGKPGADDH
ncbi:hypothetical protein B0H10DRAFT_2170100 [Mycena sp. CBHHK59/15]|nr:hypothetical protein B0H10DRAFT_2170100 [Mycena sp. CBHHK59/15]